MEDLADSEYLVAVENNTITLYFFSEAPQGTTLRFKPVKRAFLVLYSLKMLDSPLGGSGKKR